MKALSLTLLLVCVFAWGEDGERKIEQRKEITTQSEEFRTIEYTRKKGTRVFLFLFDYSGSTAENNLIATNKERLRQMLDTYGNVAGFMAGLIPFSGCYAQHENDPELLSNIIPIAARTADRILGKVEPLRPYKNTALADAIKAGLNIVKSHPDWFVEVILYTDYLDTCNGNWRELLKLLQEQYMTVTDKQKIRRIETRVSINVMTEKAIGARSALKALAELTRGRFLEGQAQQDKFMLELDEQAKRGELHIVDDTVMKMEASQQKQHQRELEEAGEGNTSQRGQEKQKQKAKTEKKGNN